MDEHDFGDVIHLIRKEDSRYERRAYFFLRDALDHTVGAMRKAEAKSGKKRESNHVTGQELLEGIRDYALAQYGPMAHLVLSSWGIRRCGDFGEMVYQLIEHGVFSKPEADRKEDFSELFEFEDVFVKPFQPKRRRLPAPPLANSEVS